MTIERPPRVAAARCRILLLRGPFRRRIESPRSSRCREVGRDGPRGARGRISRTGRIRGAPAPSRATDASGGSGPVRRGDRQPDDPASVRRRGRARSGRRLARGRRGPGPCPDQRPRRPRPDALAAVPDALGEATCAAISTSKATSGRPSRPAGRSTSAGSVDRPRPAGPRLPRAPRAAAAPPLRRIARLSGGATRGRATSPRSGSTTTSATTSTRLWLDRRLVYSCALLRRSDPDDDARRRAGGEARPDLPQAPARARACACSTSAAAGARSILYAAERYGVEAIGVTLSEAQAGWAAAEIAAARAEATVPRVAVRDYRDLAPLRSVRRGRLGRHVRARRTRAACRTTSPRRSPPLRPGGLFLNHGIATTARRWPARRRRRRFGGGASSAATSSRRGARPGRGGDRVARAAGFELLDVQPLRPHYALTLQAWVERLEPLGRAVAAAGTEVYRTWRLYMAAARTASRTATSTSRSCSSLARADGSRRPATSTVVVSSVRQTAG